MVEEFIGEFDSVFDALISNDSLQLAFLILLAGIVIIILTYRKFSNWILTKKFSYARPHLSNFLKTALLPLFAFVLIASVNQYVQVIDLFPGVQLNEEQIHQLFVKILTSLNLAVIGYTVSHLVPIILRKRNTSNEEWRDFIKWRDSRGFEDDEDDLFHKIYKWKSPENPPEGLDESEFEKLLNTKEGRRTLENYRTKKGFEIGTLVPLVKDPFETWKKSERKKYEKYYEKCTSGNNQAGQKLRPGMKPSEIFSIDQWRQEKRLHYYAPVGAGAKPSGYAEKQQELLPKSLTSFIPPMIFSGFLIGVLVWWDVDLFVLATALAGLGVGVGFALKETLENLFAYFMIRKDKVFVEGDRVLIDGYNGYVHKITTRITYIRHALNESIAIFPTRLMVGSKVINFSKYNDFVPAQIQIGTSYLNDPQQVCSILVKVGKRAMKEVMDDNGRHLAVQERCPYLDQNKTSCGCDQEITDMEQPWVLFDEFADSALIFQMWIYVRDYGSQFKMKSNLRLMVYQEFKKHDIRIPWPIRTIYSGDQAKEEKEIEQLEDLRQKTFDEYGPGDMNKF